MKTSEGFTFNSDRFFSRSRAAEENGQSLVELSLLIPILAVLILGAGEFARLAYAQIEVTNAARAGVAYGAQNSTTAKDTTGMQTAAVNDGADVSGLKPKGIAATAVRSCTCSDGTPVTCTTVSTNCSAREVDYVQVNTTATMDPVIHIPGFPTSYSLVGQATMRVAQ